jgi:hypothetical protein
MVRGDPALRLQASQRKRRLVESITRLSGGEIPPPGAGYETVIDTD